MKMLRLSHKYIGILLAYVGFFIFFSGTLGYYKNEITLFMQPEYYKLDYKSPNALRGGVEYLSKHHTNADVWEITPPSSSSPFVMLSYKNDKETRQCRREKPRINLNPETGERVKARSTYGGNFISKLHFNLWYISAAKGREIMGYATLLMILTIVTGVVIHKRIFKDFFKFRKNVLWRDSHIVASVSGLVIFFMLAVSGLYLVERFMLKEIYADVSAQNQATMQQDFLEKAKAKREARKKTRKTIEQNATQATQNLVKTSNKTKYTPTLNEIENIINSNLKGRDLKNISIQKDASDTAYVQLNFDSKNPFSQNGLSFNAELYNVKTGELVDSVNERELDRGQKVSQFMKVFHMGLFGSEITKFIFFIFGCLGLMMCFSGAILWQKKSRSKTALYLGRFLNGSIFIGLFAGFGMYLLSNQLIKFSTPLRHNLEVNAFFTALIIATLLSAILIKKYAYTILSFITSFLFLASGVIAFGAGSYANSTALLVTLFCFALSALFGYLGNKFLKDKK
ncbi:MAG: hypothetical protein GX282_06490 [Campylobacteraceae bacterium]|nr:hypothetical protein [Campylobacteraceae bacterium]